MLRNYGKKYNPFDSEILGFNSRLDELQAAVLRIKLNYLDSMNKKRTRLVNLYKKGLKNTPVTFLKEYYQVKSNYHILTVLCRKKRDELIKYLEKNKIQTNIYYPKPLHMMRAFKKYIKKSDRLNISEKISKQAIALPLYPELKEEKVKFIIEKIKIYFG